MAVEIIMRNDIRELLDHADGPVTWEGSGAEAKGLTGEAAPEDLAKVFGETPPEEEHLSLIEQMRLDGTL